MKILTDEIITAVKLGTTNIRIIKALFEAELTELAIEMARYNQTKAAKYMDVSRNTFRKLLKWHFNSKYMK